MFVEGDSLGMKVRLLLFYRPRPTSFEQRALMVVTMNKSRSSLVSRNTWDDNGNDIPYCSFQLTASILL